jgi:hypothetical protein
VRKLIVSALVATSVFGGVGLARADQPTDPGREFGQCTAFFNGQKNGHPENTEQVVSDMYDSCQQYGIGGNPSHGRYPECFDGDSNHDGDPCND